MTEANDQELSRRFIALRTSDASAAPLFVNSLNATAIATPEGSRAQPRLRKARLVVGAFALAGAAALVILQSRNQQLPGSDIVAWRAVTDELLVPRSQLFTMMPSLGSSVLDKVIP